MRKESGEILLNVQNCRGGGEKKLIFSSFLDPQSFLVLFALFYFILFLDGGQEILVKFQWVQTGIWKRKLKKK